jgi:hypothetical protein
MRQGTPKVIKNRERGNPKPGWSSSTLTAPNASALWLEIACSKRKIKKASSYQIVNSTDVLNLTFLVFSLLETS